MIETDKLLQEIHACNEVFIYRSIRNFVKFLKARGLSLPQIGALFRIGTSTCGVSDLGGKLGITPAAASQMLDRLFQQELILRTEDPLDRRAKRLALTDKGKQVLRDSITTLQEWTDDQARTLDPAEREKVAEALQILLNKVNPLNDMDKFLLSRIKTLQEIH